MAKVRQSLGVPRGFAPAATGMGPPGRLFLPALFAAASANVRLTSARGNKDPLPIFSGSGANCAGR
eukprot:6918772-Lingulodinium_polyedra.AAC.1